MKPSQALRQHRDAILRIIARHRGLRPRVYGSVARGEDQEDSDLDILIEVLPDADIFDLGAMHTDLEYLLDVAVDVKTLSELPEASRARVLREARDILATHPDGHSRDVCTKARIQAVSPSSSYTIR